MTFYCNFTPSTLEFSAATFHSAPKTTPDEPKTSHHFYSTADCLLLIIFNTITSTSGRLIQHSQPHHYGMPQDAAQLLLSNSPSRPIKQVYTALSKHTSRSNIFATRCSSSLPHPHHRALPIHPTNMVLSQNSSDPQLNLNIQPHTHKPNIHFPLSPHHITHGLRELRLIPTLEHLHPERESQQLPCSQTQHARRLARHSTRRPGVYQRCYAQVIHDFRTTRPPKDKQRTQVTYKSV